MTKRVAAAVEAALDPGEQLLWSGAPDRKVMLKTMGWERVSQLVKLAREVAFFGLLGAVVWLNRDKFGGTGSDGAFSEAGLMIVAVAVVAMITAIALGKNLRARRHLAGLAYGITDRRLLILLRGEVIESATPERLGAVQMVEREGAPGYHDILWGGRKLDLPVKRNIDRVDLERARIGFKALRDGPSVMERVEALRSGSSV